MEEFYRQGETERAKHVQIIAGGFSFLNRQTPVPLEKFQLGFIKAICVPLYKELAAVSDFDISVCVNQLEQNTRVWQNKVLRNALKDGPAGAAGDGAEVPAAIEEGAEEAGLQDTSAAAAAEEAAAAAVPAVKSCS